jgi:hypothetical protein
LLLVRHNQWATPLRIFFFPALANGRHASRT